MNTKIVKLDINRNLYDTLTAKQGDTQSRFLLFQLLDGAIPFSLENRSVKVFATKPDGKEVFNDLIINDRVKGYCTLELTNQMLAVPGLLKLELMVIEGDKKLTTNVFYMDVKKSINSENAIVSTNEFSALLNGLASLNEYDNYKNEIAAARDGEVNLLTKVKKIDEHLDNNTNKIDNNISSFDKNLIEVKERLFDTNLKNRQYIFVGDSLREANGRWVFKKMAYKLAKYGISPCLIGKSGLKAEHWSKTNIVQSLNEFPTTDDVIKVIKGDGSECVIDICLCTNDLSKTENEVVGYLKKGISDILALKPNVKFILTTPHRYMNTITNNVKAYNIIKTVVNDLGNVAFSDVQSNVFREDEDMTPYMLDDIHPNKLGQSKIGEYKIKELFDGSETVTHDINFNTITFDNTDGSITTIKYAVDYTNSDNHTLYLKQDYQNKWCFAIIVNSNWVYSSELIASEGFNILMPRFNSNDSLYGIIEVENLQGLIDNASSSTLVLSTSNYNISNKITSPLIQTESTIYNILNNIKFWELNGRIDETDAKYKELFEVSLQVGFYKTEGDDPTSVYLKRITENELYLVNESGGAIVKQTYINKDGIYDLKAITWDTIRATGKLKIKGLSKLKEVIAVGGQVKLINAQHYSPIVEKSIIELLDY